MAPGPRATSNNSQEGDQDTPDTETEVNNRQAGQDQADRANDPNSDNAQEGEQNAPDPSVETAKDQDRQEATPAAQPAITAAAAQQTAEAHLKAGRASKVALDDENGQLIYSIQIGNTEVKVDAMTGAVLSTGHAED